MDGVNEVLELRLVSHAEENTLLGEDLEGSDQLGDWPLGRVEAVDQDCPSRVSAECDELDAVGQSAPIHREGREDVLDARVVRSVVVAVHAGHLDLDAPRGWLLEDEIALLP